MITFRDKIMLPTTEHTYHFKLGDHPSEEQMKSASSDTIFTMEYWIDEKITKDDNTLLLNEFNGGVPLQSIVPLLEYFTEGIFITKVDTILAPYTDNKLRLLVLVKFVAKVADDRYELTNPPDYITAAHGGLFQPFIASDLKNIAMMFDAATKDTDNKSSSGDQTEQMLREWFDAITGIDAMDKFMDRLDIDDRMVDSTIHTTPNGIACISVNMESVKGIFEKYAGKPLDQCDKSDDVMIVMINKICGELCMPILMHDAIIIPTVHIVRAANGNAVLVADFTGDFHLALKKDEDDDTSTFATVSFKPDHPYGMTRIGRGWREREVTITQTDSVFEIKPVDMYAIVMECMNYMGMYYSKCCMRNIIRYESGAYLPFGSFTFPSYDTDGTLLLSVHDRKCTLYNNKHPSHGKEVPIPLVGTMYIFDMHGKPKFDSKTFHHDVTPSGDQYTFKMQYKPAYLSSSSSHTEAYVGAGCPTSQIYEIEYLMQDCLVYSSRGSQLICYTNVMPEIRTDTKTVLLNAHAVNYYFENELAKFKEKSSSPSVITSTLIAYTDENNNT